MRAVRANGSDRLKFQDVCIHTYSEREREEEREESITNY